MTTRRSSSTRGRNPAITPGTPTLPSPPITSSDPSVLLAGLMGLEPTKSPALSTSFATSPTPGLGRRPALSKRVVIGGM